MNTLLDLAKFISENSADDCNFITNKFDFTKKADLDKLNDSVEKIKNNDSFLQMMNVFNPNFSKSLNSLLDTIVVEAQKIYDNSHKNDNIIRKEVDNSIMNISEQRPSEKVSEEMKKQITKLTVEYMNDVIIPNYKNIKTEQAVSIHDALFEFACWIYSK